jgi:predicted RNA binding protein YcfA (HicA-like mRNA interferase family)
MLTHQSVSPRKELKEMLAAARAQGWRVEQRRSGHYLLYAPDGVHIVTVAGTPSDRRAIEITAARMRRYGFRWKGR